MYILVSYDIVNDKIRNRVMKVLRNHGHRVQLSVYECDIDELQYEKLKWKLENLIQKHLDSVRYYRLCKGCLKNVETCGWGERMEDEGFQII